MYTVQCSWLQLCFSTVHCAVCMGKRVWRELEVAEGGRGVEGKEKVGMKEERRKRLLKVEGGEGWYSWGNGR